MQCKVTTGVQWKVTLAAAVVVGVCVYNDLDSSSSRRHEVMMHPAAAAGVPGPVNSSSCVKDTTNLVQDKEGSPINVVMNEGPGLMFKEVPPDFEVQHMEVFMLLTIIKKVTRYRSFVSKEMLYCCKLWIVSICKLWIVSIYKLWIVSSTYFCKLLSKYDLEVHVCKYFCKIRWIISFCKHFCKVIHPSAFLKVMSASYVGLFLSANIISAKLFIQVHF